MTTTEIDLAPVRQALAGMPYSGMAPSPQAISDADGLMSWLNAMTLVLQGVAARAAATERERDTLVHQRTAVRAFLGTDAL